MRRFHSPTTFVGMTLIAAIAAKTAWAQEPAIPMHEGADPSFDDSSGSPQMSIEDAAPAAPASIADFVNCLNTSLPSSKISIADVPPVCPPPPGCGVIVTMSKSSAQAACNLGMTQLPRVIFTCPADNPTFQPSYLLCPLDSSEPTGLPGLNRIEIGEEVSGLRMADIPIGPNAHFVGVVFDRVVSREADGKDGTKDCNSGGCHGDGGRIKIAAGNIQQLSVPEPADPKLVISSSDGSKAGNPNPATQPFKGFTLIGLSLPDVCACIDQNKDRIAKAYDASGMGKDGENVATRMSALCTNLLTPLGLTKPAKPSGACIKSP